MSKHNKHNFRNYLELSALKDSYQLGNSELLSFHWANWGHTANIIQSSAGQRRLKELDAELECLKEHDIWLKHLGEQKKLSLYELYEKYCDPEQKALLFGEKGEVLVSMGNEAGPFIRLKVMRWFDRELCAQFYYKRIIENKAALRKFRLGVHIPLHVRLEGNPFSATPGTITQVSERGLLLYIPFSSILKIWDKKDASVSFIKRPFEINNKFDICGPESFSAAFWFRTLCNFEVRLESIQEQLLKSNPKEQDQGVHLFIPYEKIEFYGLNERDHAAEIIAGLIDMQNILKKSA